MSIANFDIAEAMKGIHVFLAVAEAIRVPAVTRELAALIETARSERAAADASIAATRSRRSASLLRSRWLVGTQRLGRLHDQRADAA